MYGFGIALEKVLSLFLLCFTCGNDKPLEKGLTQVPCTNLSKLWKRVWHRCLVHFFACLGAGGKLILFFIKLSIHFNFLPANAIYSGVVF